MPASRPTRLTAAAAARLFGTLSRVRGHRALHPHAPVQTARVTLRGGVEAPSALARPRTVDALLRASKALGLPGRTDLHGLAVRLCDLHGPGRDQDLLLASSPPPPLHVVLVPSRDPERAWFTSLLPYRVGARRTLLVAHGLGGGRYALGLCRPLRRSVRWLGEIQAGPTVDPDPGEAVAFDAIMHAAPELAQDAGPLDVVRARAYAASRAGRGAPPAG